MGRNKYIVTGGTGFVGAALAKALAQRGAEVITISRRPAQELEKFGIRSAQFDLSRDQVGLAELLSGATAVFHTAAKVDMWGPYADFFRINVEGTRRLLQACRDKKVPKFIYTSSPSVVADGTNLCGIDESYPYPDRYLANYPKTKAQAEREVLEQNAEGLATLALRPHLIWGPGDQNFVPTILERARAGRLVQVGKGDNRVDLSYIDDCVQAHLKAEVALGENPNCRGRAYFISQGEPVSLWEWINQVLERHGLDPIKKKIPAGLAYALGAIGEFVSTFHPRHPEPFLTRFLASEMATSHYFSIAAAKRELGYLPEVSIVEAMERSFGSR